MQALTRTARTSMAAAIALACTASSAGAQAAASADVAIEPGAMAALQGMGAYLRTLKAFQVDATITDEEVLDDGQKILSEGTARILAHFPGRLYAEVANDRHEREYVYDGQTFTLFAKRLNFYATVPAPPSVRELADMLEETYGFSVPLVDLFRWGGPGWTASAITGAMDVGPSVVAGTTCEQYAFRQADIDWQIWIQKGEFPLPRKLAITTKTDDARPQHTATYSWNLAPSFDDRTFKFDPPQGAGRAVIGAVAK